MSHDEYVAKQRAKVVTICESILQGQTSIILGCRELLALRCEVDIDDNDTDFLTFAGIDSQTDHLPVGEEGKRWASSALAENDVEIQECERFFKDSAFQACRNLIDKFRSSG
jgi:hypothetical protein